jgi:hypothetical protein
MGLRVDLSFFFWEKEKVKRNLYECFLKYLWGLKNYVFAYVCVCVWNKKALKSVTVLN